MHEWFMYDAFISVIAPSLLMKDSRCNTQRSDGSKAKVTIDIPLELSIKRRRLISIFD
jgi:hypothetical protein